MQVISQVNADLELRAFGFDMQTLSTTRRSDRKLLEAAANDTDSTAASNLSNLTNRSNVTIKYAPDPAVVNVTLVAASASNSTPTPTMTNAAQSSTATNVSAVLLAGYRASNHSIKLIGGISVTLKPGGSSLPSEMILQVL